MTDQFVPQPPVPTTTRRSKIVLWVVIGVAALATVVVGAFLVFMNLNRGPSALEVAEEYLQHVSDGDASAANEMLAEVPDEVARLNLSDDSMLTDEVLGAASERISDVAIVTEPGYEEPAYSAILDVTYTLAGQEYETTIHLKQDDGGNWMEPARWEVLFPVTGSVLLLDDSPDITLGGVRLPTMDAADEFVSLELFPAVYPIEAVDSVFFTPESDELLISTDPGLQEQARIVPNEHFMQELQARVDEYLDVCVADTSWRPEGCPLAAPIEARGTNVTWTVDVYPTVRTELDIQMYFAEDGVVTASFTPDGAEAPVTEQITAAVSGDVLIDGSGLTITHPW